DPDDRPLQLVVSVTQDELLVWSVSGLEGTLQEPRAAIPRTGTTDQGEPAYDYAALNRALHEIASRRWQGKLRKLPTFQAVLQPDGSIPYGTIIAIMDAMRCKLPAPDAPSQVCLLPSDQEAITAA